MKLKEMYREAKEKKKEDVCRFMRDMKRAEIKLSYYEGRNFWCGPAVKVDDIQAALSSTKIQCQWDRMGHGYIVYPIQAFKMR